MFDELGYDMDDSGITEWLESDCGLSGNQVFTDSEICDLVSQGDMCTLEFEEEEEEGHEDIEEEKCLVSHSNAAVMFEQCLSWLEHQPEANVYNTTILRELQSLAALKRVDCLKQRKISTYFKEE